MSQTYRLLYQTVLRHLDPETAHRLGLRYLRRLQRSSGGLTRLRRRAAPADERLRCKVLGLTFANPLGLAAGMDKEAEIVTAAFALGFGHVEVGTVTPRPQPGNPRPRLWRVPDRNALINAMGFPSHGASVVRDHLCERLGEPAEDLAGVVGINLGKNRDTPLDRAAEDYCALVRELAAHADYFTVNVSSPNTPGLRTLQLGEQLEQLLQAVLRTNRQVADELGSAPRPVLLKVAPDLSDAELIQVATTAARAGISGLVATNTTISRASLSPRHQALPGGLSGAPLRERSREVIRLLYQHVGRDLPIIGVGGVASAADVLGHIRAGASLVQLYTGFVYGGPNTAGEIVRDLTAAADAEGWASIGELVGTL